MHSALLVLLSLLGIYILQALLEFRRAIHSVGWVSLRPRNDITESYPGRHLPGPRLLFNPTWVLGQMIRRALPPFRYVSRGGSWVLREGYQGEGCATAYEIMMRVTALRTVDFAAAGKDAIALVSSLYSTCERTSRTADC